MTPLQMAAERGDLQSAKALIAGGADVNAPGPHGDRALHRALLCALRIRHYPRTAQDGARPMEIVPLLVSKGADVNARDGDGATPLHLAAQLGDVRTAKLLLRRGADATARTTHDMTTVHFALSYLVACERDKRSPQPPAHPTELMQLLVAKGAEISRANYQGYTPLHTAVYLSNPEPAEFLVSHGADPDAPSSEGHTPLHLASMYDNKELVRLLVAHGANLDARDHDGATPLHLARGVAVARALLDAGADTEAKNKDGMTPLFCAVEGMPFFAQQRMDLVTELLNRGADINTTRRDGETPLLAAAGSTELAMFALLVTRGADLSARDRSGTSVMEVEAENNHAALVRVLKSNDRGSKQKVYFACLRAALMEGYDDQVKLLIANGLDVRTRDANGYTALHYAATSRDRDVLAMLIKAGADVNARNRFGETPLFTSLYYRDPYGTAVGYLGRTQSTTNVDADRQSREVLVKAGADLNARNIEGRTPLHIAAMCMDDGAAACDLIALGADVNVADRWENTPLYYATDKLMAVKSLVSHGARVNARNCDGITPLAIAASRARANDPAPGDSSAVVAYLRAHGGKQ